MSNKPRFFRIANLPNKGSSCRKFISATEAADKIGVHVETLRRWEESGSIEVHRTPGGHRRYEYQEVINFIEGQVKFSLIRRDLEWLSDKRFIIGGYPAVIKESEMTGISADKVYCEQPLNIRSECSVHSPCLVKWKSLSDGKPIYNMFPGKESKRGYRIDPTERKYKNLGSPIGNMVIETVCDGVHTKQIEDIYYLDEDWIVDVFEQQWKQPRSMEWVSLRAYLVVKDQALEVE